MENDFDLLSSKSFTWGVIKEIISLDEGLMPLRRQAII